MAAQGGAVEEGAGEGEAVEEMAGEGAALRLCLPIWFPLTAMFTESLPRRPCCSTCRTGSASSLHLHSSLNSVDRSRFKVISLIALLHCHALLRPLSEVVASSSTMLAKADSSE